MSLNSSVPNMSSLLMICFPSFILFPSKAIAIFSSLFLRLSWMMCSSRVRWHISGGREALLCLVLLCRRKNLCKVRNLRKRIIIGGKTGETFLLKISSESVFTYPLIMHKNVWKIHVKTCFHNLLMMRYEQFKVRKDF